MIPENAGSIFKMNMQKNRYTKICDNAKYWKCFLINMKKNRYNQIHQFHWKVIFVRCPYQKVSLSLFIILQIFLAGGIVAERQCTKDTNMAKPSLTPLISPTKSPHESPLSSSFHAPELQTVFR